MRENVMLLFLFCFVLFCFVLFFLGQKKITKSSFNIRERDVFRKKKM